MNENQKLRQLTGNRHHTVGQSNEFTEAAYVLGLVEKRIVQYGQTRVTWSNYPLYGGDLDFDFTIHEYLRFYQLTNDVGNWETLRDACMSLLDKHFSLRPPNAKRKKNGGINKHTGIHISFLSSCRFDERENRIYGVFTPESMEYFCNQQKRFTRYELEQTANLTSFYAIRLYELLSRWQHTRKWITNQDEIRRIFCLEEKYDKYSELHRNVITPSMEQLKKHTDIQPECELTYEGKTVTDIVFTWK